MHESDPIIPSIIKYYEMTLAIHSRFLDDMQLSRRDVDWISAEHDYWDTLHFVSIAKKGGFYILRLEDVQFLHDHFSLILK